MNDYTFNSTLRLYDRLYGYTVIRLYHYTIILRWDSMEDSTLGHYDRFYAGTL